jgi:hypothetical protein
LFASKRTALNSGVAMETIGQIIGFVASIILFRLAYKFFAKEKHPTSALLASLGVIVLFCSFPWFQGFVKTWVNSNVNSKLAALGQQVNDVQAATTEMHGQLANHQTQIDKHQKELDDVQVKVRNAQSDVLNQQTKITLQYQQISNVQSALTTAQTNIDMQEKKIEDVEFLVDNFFSKTVEDRLSANDTNRVTCLKLDNDTYHVAIKLRFAPIKGSIQVIAGVNGGIPQTVYYDTTIYKNVIFYSLHGYDINNTFLSMRYVKDSRETNLVNNVEFKDKRVISCDGVLITIGNF